MPTLRELEGQEQRLRDELFQVRLAIQKREPTRTHKCVWCGKRAQRRHINLHISLYHDWAGDGDHHETCCKMQCPHCERWTRYYAEWTKVIGSRIYFKSVDRSTKDPGRWRNAPGQ